MSHPTRRAPAADELARLPDDSQARSESPRETAYASLDRLDLRFDEFLEFARTGLGHSDASRRWYKHSYQNFRKFLAARAGFGGDIRPHLFLIEEWVRWNRELKRTPVTLLNYYRGLQAFFRDLEERDSIPSPFRGARAPAAQKRVPKARTADECRRIVDAARNIPWPTDFHRARAVAMLGCMMFAGLRKGEVMRVQFHHVDIGEGTIFIERGKGRFGGKDRVAYMPPELAYILRDYQRERSRRRLEAPEFFCGLRNLGVSEATLRRTVARVRRASGVPFSMHSLRHSFVTMLLKSGVPIHVASELAGHNSIATTAGYLRVFDDDKRAGARRLKLFSSR